MKMKMGMKLFKCPMCKSEGNLEEIVIGATITNKLTGLYDEDDIGEAELAYDGMADDIYDGEVNRYQCGSCGYVIPDVHEPEGMIEYLKEHGTEI